MSYESFHQPEPSREVLQAQRAMIRLGFDIDKFGNYSQGLAKSLNVYLREEYGLEVSDARQYIRLLEADGTLPNRVKYESGDERLRDEYRLAVYTHLIPLYRDMHSRDEFEAWLPAAIDAVFPAGDMHLEGLCRPSGEEAIDYKGAACLLSTHCRRRVVIADMVQNGAFLGRGHGDMLNYECDIRSEWESYDDSVVLLQALAERGVFDEDGALVTEMRLRSKLYEKLGNANEPRA